MSQPVPTPLTSATIRSGIPAVDRYLDAGYATVPGMSSRFAAAICCGLLRIQSELGVTGPVVEVGPFEGRFFIALAHALAGGETALGIDLFDWPNPQVIDRFEANCRQARRARGAAHHLEGRQPHHAARGAAGQARRPAPALHPYRRRAFARSAHQGPGARDRRAGARRRHRARRHAAPRLSDADGGRARVSRAPSGHVRARASSIARPSSPPPSSCSAAPSGSSATRKSCSRPTRTTSGRWAPTSSRTGAWCCRSTPGWPRSSEAHGLACATAVRADARSSAASSSFNRM